MIPLKALANQDNIYYSVKSYPEGLQPLSSFEWQKASNPERALLQIAQGVLQGLLAFREAARSIYLERALPQTLSLKDFFVSQGTQLAVYLDCYIESFLYFGDDLESALEARFYPALHDAKSPLFQDECLFQAEERLGRLGRFDPISYAFTALMYQLIGQKKPLGYFASLAELAPERDPFWSHLVEESFSFPKSPEELLKSLSAYEQKLSTPKLTAIRREPTPEGMSLIEFSDKVLLGADDGAENERPRFRAKIAPFFLDQRPITNRQFQAFFPAYQRSIYSKGDDQPATLISWHMARAYCQWRSEREGLPPGTYRLPSEYEWEAAALGQSSLDPSLICCAQDKMSGARPVSSFAKDSFQLQGMLGNVFEWTASPYQSHPFAKTPKKNPSLYIVKGGCWFTPAQECRPSLRNAHSPSVQLGHIGFRCARSLVPYPFNGELPN
ncbi:MAG: Sulphatase-modifying factor protein [Chlamydiales bacterium]|nr:Sulphatase-modifying factor protein [Chlamydiales bacterium]